MADHPDDRQWRNDVTPDEKTLFFVSYVTDVASSIAIQENAIGTTTLVPHPELGNRIVSWISSDGCEVFLSGLSTADLMYAKRSPK